MPYNYDAQMDNRNMKFGVKAHHKYWAGQSSVQKAQENKHGVTT